MTLSSQLFDVLCTFNVVVVEGADQTPEVLLTPKQSSPSVAAVSVLAKSPRKREVFNSYVCRIFSNILASLSALLLPILAQIFSALEINTRQSNNGNGKVNNDDFRRRRYSI